MGKNLMIAQTGYAVTMFIALALTAAGMFTPGWRTYDPHNDDLEKELFELHCPKSSKKLGKKCDWWEDQPTWNKICFIAISLAIMLQLMALTWAVLAFVLTGYRKIQMFCLIALSIIICFLLSTVLTNFATNDIQTYEVKTQKFKVGIGYSYFITCGAFIVSFITVLFGIAAARSAGKEVKNEYTDDVYHW
uniref:Uncharacterized protein n=1 Tax=Panagrolaimus sp. PS1159 TaxID=55785 RepID=A0AC35FI91_9BILA